MRRTATALVALLTATAMLFAGPGVAFAQETTATPTPTETPDGTETATPTPEDEMEPDENASENASVAPGERLSAVIGVEEEELEGELGSRTFGLKVAQAASNNSRLAEVVAEEYEETSERVAEIEQRKEALNESRENGSISEGEYKARMTVLAAQAQNAERQANMTANASEKVPAELLEEKGINASAIQRLQANASNLTGPEVAAIAQSIAGKGVGAGMADEKRPDDAGAPEDRGGDANRTDSDQRGDGTNRSDTNGTDTGGQDSGMNQSDSDDTTETSDGGTDRQAGESGGN